jgi:putative PIG3 family NAD(P)H quinone oxidoreductase
VRFLSINEQQTLNFNEIQRPSIGDDECLINVRAIGINRADILQKQGKYPAPKGESEILGIEVCGDIVEIGSQQHCPSLNASDWKKGDKVFAIVPGGGYAEYVKVKIAHLFKLPSQLTYSQGAAIAEVYLTAYQCLFAIAKLKKNSRVLIHAGASGVGSAAIQLAKRYQCHVTVTVGSDKKAQACKALGADVALNYQQTDFAFWSKTHQAQGYDVIIDVVASDYLNKNINVCAVDGHIVMLSMLGGRYAKELDVAKMLLKRVNITATTLRSRSDDYKSKLIADFKAEFEPDLLSNKIQPVIFQEYAWQNVECAHQVMQNNENIGKLILTID